MWGFSILYEKLNYVSDDLQRVVLIGSVVITLIGHRQTDRQTTKVKFLKTNRKRDKE